MAQSIQYDAFLSHSHLDAEIVEALAKRLEDDAGLHVWLDKWVLVPGAMMGPADNGNEIDPNTLALARMFGHIRDFGLDWSPDRPAPLGNRVGRSATDAPLEAVFCQRPWN